MRFFMNNYLRYLIAAIMALAVSGVAISQDVELRPGYIAGTVRIGDTAETELQRSIHGARYGSQSSDAWFSPATPGNSLAYNLTVQVEEGTTRNYYMDVTAYMDSGKDWLSFPRRYGIQVPEGGTAVEDFILDEPGFIEGTVTVIGGSLGSARMRATSSTLPRTIAGSDTRSAQGGFYRFPVVPGDDIELRASIYPSGSSGVNLYETIDVAAGETVVVNFEITYTPPTGSITGTVGLSGPLLVTRYWVATQGAYRDYRSGFGPDNTRDFSLTRLADGPRYFGVSAYIGGGSLNFPHSAFDPALPVDIVNGSSEVVNAFTQQAFLAGNLNIRGSVSYDDLAPVRNDVNARGSGELASGASSNSVINNASGDYLNVITPGDWQIRRISLNFARTEPTLIKSVFNLSTFEGNDGLSDVLTVAAGETVNRDFDLPMGTATVNFSVFGGGTLSNPQLSGPCEFLDPGTGELLTRYNVNGYPSLVDVTEAAVTVVGLAGTCELRARARVGGSTVTFAEITLDIVPGVDVVIDIGAPALSVDYPEPDLCIEADQITVQGTVSDDTEVDSVTVNGVVATLTPASGANNFTWEATIPLPVKGPNTIVTTAIDTAGNEASDTRTVFNDAGPPVLDFVPVNETVTSQLLIDVEGTATDDAGVASVLVNGQQAVLTEIEPGVSWFSVSVPLDPGSNFIEVVATDISNKSSAEVRKVTAVGGLSLTPETASNPVNTEHCVVAAVLDHNEVLLNGIPVGFDVTGANATSGAGSTDDNGEAQFCYTGTSIGNDDIVAAVGNLTASVTKTWEPLQCDIDTDGVVGPTDIDLIIAVRNTPALPDDPRDNDESGVIDVNDARQCVLLCTLPLCEAVIQPFEQSGSGC